MKSTIRYWYKTVVPALLALMSFQLVQHQPWQFFNGSFRPDQVARVEKWAIAFQDTIPNDTIYACLSDKNVPVAFYREVHTGVCLEGVCLPVHLYIYWTVSGNYLGFKLGNGEILTKNNHDPFTEADYRRLHVLLSDPQSLLGGYSIEEIAMGRKDTSDVDGISGATLADLRGYIVAGAAYTTHTLWQIAYRANRDSVINIASRYVSLPLISQLLESDNMQDKVWALEHMDLLKESLSAVLPRVQDLIKKDNFYVKEKALAALMSSSQPELSVQKALFDVFVNSDFGVKRLVTRYLSQYHSLSYEMVDGFCKQLSSEPDAVISLVFNLFKTVAVSDQESVRRISRLLDEKRRTLSQSAYGYLSSLERKEPWLTERLNQYSANLH